jgi:hypothetical protein
MSHLPGNQEAAESSPSESTALPVAIAADANPATEDAPADDSEQDQGQARPAEVVTGAWLTCGNVKSGELTADSQYGCGYYSAGKKVTLKIDSWRIAITMISDGTKITPELTPATDASPWHVEFLIPANVAVELVTISAIITIDGQDYLNKIEMKPTRVVAPTALPVLPPAERAFLTSFNFTYSAAGARPVQLRWTWPANASDFKDFTIRYRPGVTPPNASCDDATDQIEGPTQIITSFNGNNHAIDLDKSGCACSFRVCVRDKSDGLYSNHTATPP